MAKKIQPMRFSGRCEVIKAPTTENDTVRLARVSIDGPQAMKISARVRPLRRARIGVAAASARHTTHTDQARQEAARRLTLGRIIRFTVRGFSLWCLLDRPWSCRSY